ncbi:hypothetical protein BD779DRAFT_1563878 [Infundibulicybe gibba]|nr:hypothetical protein BD779DRAFT_1563878 [Infundibulicybe gibba]
MTGTTSRSADAPPPFDPVNMVEIHSLTDGKIINVNLYSGRAEITRLYKVNARTGQNKFNITGLPNVLDRDSLRVEGRGKATIHDVTLSETPRQAAPTTSPALEALQAKRTYADQALNRCQALLRSIKIYIDTASVQHIAPTELSSVIDNYLGASERLDNRVIELEQELKAIDANIKKEQDSLGGPLESELLRQRVSVGVFAEVGGDVEVVLIYAVRNANWEAAYDIRVETSGKDKQVTLIYKAMITQSTGEAWDDVPLTLETAAPTFGAGIPTLTDWTISTYRPPMPMMKTTKKTRGISPMSIPMPSLRRRTLVDMVEEQDEDEDMAFELYGGESMQHRGLVVSSKGNISATFRIPGLISVPTDGGSHNVTIVELKLDATMSWVTVPSQDPKTHLKAKIKNASEYTLLQGQGSVYVMDPQEASTALGKTSHSGFYSKTSNQVYSQRITVFNTKSIPISDLKVMDRIPVSEDSQITVKLVNPALTLPTAPTEGSSSKVPPPVSVSSEVSAQWEGADETGVDVESLGKDGKLNWTCSVPAQGKLNLLLSWEVAAPSNTTIVGL